MLYMAFAIIVIGTLAIAAWLTIEGHPWIAVLMLLLGCSVSIKSGE